MSGRSLSISYEGTLTVKEISSWIHKSEYFVRRGIENGSLDIGGYVKEGSKGSYYISPKLAWERLGYRRDEKNTYINDPADVGINGS